MKKYTKPKPELSDFLKSDQLKRKIDTAFKLGDHVSVFEMVNNATISFEKALINWYDKKAIQESSTISEKDKKLSRDLENLGF